MVGAWLGQRVLGRAGEAPLPSTRCRTADSNVPVMCVGVPKLAGIADFHCTLHLRQQVQVVTIYHIGPFPGQLQLEGEKR